MVVLAGDYPPALGGIQRYAHELANALHLRGVAVAVIASAQPGDEEFDRAQPFPTLRVPCPTKQAATLNMLAALNSPQLLTELGGAPELVFCANWFPEGPAARLYHQRGGAPYVLLSHGRETTLTGLNLVKYLMQRNVVGGAAAGVTNSNYTAGQVQRRGLAPERTRVILAGVRPEDFQPESHRIAALRERFGLSGKRVLLTVSRLVARKGQLQVLRALPRIRERVPEAHYLIVGEGPEEDHIKAEIERLDLAAAVTLAGAVSHQELPHLYALADIFVMTSLDLPGQPIEGFGLVYLEAALCGTPVVAGNTGGVADAVLDGETGLLVDPRETEQIAAACLRLLEDPSLAAGLVAASKRRISRSLTWDHVAARTLEALREWGLLAPPEGDHE
jgi:phosphatidylinositol alpha-1,6-mannosyltransferase